MSPELEQKLGSMSSHRSVLGYLLIARGSHPSIIRHSGVVFEGEQGKKYASMVAKIVQSVQSGLDEVRRDDAAPASTTDESVRAESPWMDMDAHLRCRMKSSSYGYGRGGMS
jgi:dynein light chain roadblock-type